MKILGIETTCDETACAIVENGVILSNKIATQTELHEYFGGVVPELASREHARHFLPLLDLTLKESEIELQEVDAIGVAYGPGLIGSLLVGVNGAKVLAKTLKKPLIFVNHIEAHLYAAAMQHEDRIEFPALGVVLSGGHTALVKMNHFGSYELIGETVDDAIGEAFDKVAKMMRLPYPGGPIIEKMALNGDSHRFDFRGGRIKGSPLDFSFSGLKTKVLYSLFGQNGQVDVREVSESFKNDIAASFQRAAFEDVVKKTLIAAKNLQIKTILFGGGVTNNRALRALFNEAENDFEYLFPPFELTLDNAAMIAGLAEWRILNLEFHPLNCSPTPRIPFLKNPIPLPDSSAYLNLDSSSLKLT